MKFVSLPRLDDYDNSELVLMSPKRFLELSMKRKIKKSRFDESAYDQKSLKNLRMRIENELEIDPPTLRVESKTGRVIDHSGRHRAFTAYDLGIKKIPVFVTYIEYNVSKLGQIDRVELPLQKIPKHLTFKSEIKRRVWEIK